MVPPAALPVPSPPLRTAPGGKFLKIRGCSPPSPPHSRRGARRGQLRAPSHGAERGSSAGVSGWREGAACGWGGSSLRHRICTAGGSSRSLAAPLPPGAGIPRCPAGQKGCARPPRPAEGRAGWRGAGGARPASCGAAGLPVRISGSLGSLCAPLPGMGWGWGGYRGAQAAARSALQGGQVPAEGPRSPRAPRSATWAPRLRLPRRHPAVDSSAAPPPPLPAAPKLLGKFRGGAGAPHRAGNRRRRAWRVARCAAAFPPWETPGAGLLPALTSCCGPVRG